MKHKRLHTAPDGLRTYVLVFDRGDELFSLLSDFAETMKLDAASFTAIGALERVNFGWFDWETKKYLYNAIEEQVELLTLAGDIASKDGKSAVHAHLSVAKRDGTAWGGHLKEAIVRPTVELVLTETPAHLKRQWTPRAASH